MPKNAEQLKNQLDAIEGQLRSVSGVLVALRKKLRMITEQTYHKRDEQKILDIKNKINSISE